MGMAKMAKAPVLLVGDIDRGGVFAQLIGTVELLEDDEKAMVKGLIINKFRGDKTILDPGVVMLEERSGIPVVGVAPYLDIQVEDEDYGIWYMDVAERPEAYEGRKVRFKGQVLKNKYFKDKNFVPGRKVMTCCADDTQFIGYISFYNNIAALENREWIWVTATIKYEFQMAYKKKGPVLYVESIEKTGAPREEMVFF